MNFQSILIFVLALLLAMHAEMRSGIAHVVPEGQIERSAQVVVHDHRILIEVRVSINEKTMLKLVNQGRAKALEGEAAWQAFFEWSAKQVASSTDLQVNGAICKTVMTKMVPRSRRHVDCSIHLEALIPIEADRAKLDLEFEAFNGYPGTWKQAIKPKGNAVIAKSESAPILIRAKPVDLVKMEPDQRSKLESISCEVIIAK